MSHLLAAEWSVQPAISMLADYDSNRSLSPHSLGGSEEAVLYTDLRLQRAIENTQIFIEPKFDVRRYSSSIWGAGNDRSLDASFNYTGERAKFNLTGSIADQTTLTTEVLETGIINGSTGRRLTQGGTEWDWSESALFQSFIQAAYMRSAYSGGSPLVQLQLPGYHYTSGSVGERFLWSEGWTFTASAFGDVLQSGRQGGSSHEEGVQVDASYRYSERTQFELALGESERSLSGQSSSGTNVTAVASRTFERGSATISYNRSLVPYGTGFLVQRTQIAASLTRPLAPTLDFNISLLRLQNNAATVRLGLDRPYYNSALFGLSWHMGESWTLEPAVVLSRSKPIPPLNAPTQAEPNVFQWHAGLTLVWRPLPAAKSR
jgi:hypothetical protein